MSPRKDSGHGRKTAPPMMVRMGPEDRKELAEKAAKAGIGSLGAAMREALHAWEPAEPEPEPEAPPRDSRKVLRNVTVRG